MTPGARGGMTPGARGGMSVAGPVEIAAGLDPETVGWDANGLVAGVVQDVADGRVLMVGWLDAEALAATLDTGDVHFHSRSRHRLWKKGESSGNVLRLRTLALDCDGDALLLGVEPGGPTCHRGTRSCFDADDAVGARTADDAAGPPAADDAVGARTADDGRASVGRAQGFAWLETLWATIAERAAGREPGSYTVKLLDGGVDLAGRKVAEEATEVLLAAKNDEAAEAADADRTGTRDQLAGEAGDLLYHALVLLAERGLEPRAVLDVLRARRGRPPQG